MRAVFSFPARPVAESRSTELYYASPLRDPGQRRQDAEFSLAYIVNGVRAAVDRAVVPLEATKVGSASVSSGHTIGSRRNLPP